MFTKTGSRVSEEAAALAAGRHPGVVELVDYSNGFLRTRMVDARPLAELAGLSAGEVAGLTAAVATTLADLHDLGVVHGGIDANHVLVTAEGRPVLCSLGRGGEPADDVADLGRLATALLLNAPPETTRRPALWRVPGSSHLGSMLAPPAGPALARLAADAAAPDARVRPTSRKVAEAIRRQIPSARLPRPGPAGPAPLVPDPVVSHAALSQDDPIAAALDRPAASPRRSRSGGSPDGRLPTLQRAAPVVAGGTAGLAAMVALLAGVVAGGDWMLSRRDPPHAPTTDTRSEPAPPAPDTATPTTTTPAATRVWPADPIDFRDGVLTYRGGRYAIGRAGDAVVAADWLCTGTPTLALLQREAGRVFAFAGWPDGDNVLTGRPLAQVEGASDLQVVDGDGDGCPELEVQRPGRPPVRLRVGS